MNIEPLYLKPQKSLGKLYPVIERLIKLNMPWWDRNMTPRQLMFGLYVHYQNARLKIKDLEKQVSLSRGHVEKLNKKIKDLEEYEKQVVFSGYKAVITTHHWSCGDGCCSDSWAHYKIINRFGVCELDTQWNGSGNSYSSRYSREQEIKERYGSTIEISHEDDYGDDQDNMYS